MQNQTLVQAKRKRNEKSLYMQKRELPTYIAGMYQLENQNMTDEFIFTDYTYILISDLIQSQNTKLRYEFYLQK